MGWDIHQTPEPMLRRELIAFMRLAHACDDWQVNLKQMNALRRYAMRGYVGVNELLRGDRSQLDEWAGLDSTVSALASISPVAAPAMTLWRGVRLPESAVPRVGERWSDAAWLSCSVLRRLAERAGGRYRSHEDPSVRYVDVVWQIELAGGEPIIPAYWAFCQDEGRYERRDPPAWIANEAEILLMPATELLVESIRQRADGSLVVRARVA
jgi:hypothetical protein